MTGPEIVWEDPPVSAKAPGHPKGVGRWFTVMAELREHPGKWARFDNVHAGTGSQIKHGRQGGAKLGEIEYRFTPSPNDHTRGSLYLRVKP